jgi:amidase
MMAVWPAPLAAAAASAALAGPVTPSANSPNRAPVALSFLGPAFSEAKLLAFGRAFEQALSVRRLPVTTPPLPGEHFEY